MRAGNVCKIRVFVFATTLVLDNAHHVTYLIVVVYCLFTIEKNSVIDGIGNLVYLAT